MSSATFTTICEKCKSHAVVRCISCKQICCLICDLPGGAMKCNCGHRLILHGSLRKAGEA